MCNLNADADLNSTLCYKVKGGSIVSKPIAYSPTASDISSAKRNMGMRHGTIYSSLACSHNYDPEQIKFLTDNAGNFIELVLIGPKATCYHVLHTEYTPSQYELENRRLRRG